MGGVAIQRAIADALELWRDAERVLDAADQAIDTAEVVAVLASARAVYQSLFHAAQRGITVTDEELAASREAVSTARALLEKGARRRT
jgi:hypothetical protein